MQHLNIDLETFSSVPIAKAGLYKYVQARDFQILLFGYSLNGAAPCVIDLACGERIPEEIRALLFDAQCVKHAYNAAFEWYCLSRYFGLADPAAWLPQWNDTMLHGLYCGYPAGLDATGRALGLEQGKRKLSTGKALIRAFCVPRKPTKSNPAVRLLPAAEPEKWALFKAYNAQDVAAEQEIERRLAPWPVPGWLQEQWRTDMCINLRGVALDTDLVEGALACGLENTARCTEEAVALTGLQNPRSIAQLRGWLEAETGEEIATLRKQDVSDLLAMGLPSATANRVLELRQELGKTSTKKYDAMATALCEDGRVRGLLQYYGANRTGRWAGRLVQVQNLPQTHLRAPDLARKAVKQHDTEKLQLLWGSVPDTLSQLIRTALVPTPGGVFIDCDFSAIEARVLAYLAGEEWVLEVFRTHGKIYEAAAAQMFGVPLEKIKKGNPEYALRQKGKVATLALGYGGGVGALVNMGALRMGIPEEQLPDIRRRWREANPHIREYWYAVAGAAADAVRTGRTNAVGGLVFTLEGDSAGQVFLCVRLPAGRQLFYARPHFGVNKFGEKALCYWGMDQKTKKWNEVETFGGKLAENIVQAFARDCLAEKITLLEAAGYPVVFHVHDEVIIDYRGTLPPAEAYAEVRRIMAEPIGWAPGLPLNADGWTGAYYTKD